AASPCLMRSQFSCIQIVAPRTTGWTAARGAGYGLAMARRTVFDPLEPTKKPRWYTVRNMRGSLRRVDQWIAHRRPQTLGRVRESAGGERLCRRNQGLCDAADGD